MLIGSASPGEGKEIVVTCSICHALSKDNDEPKVGPTLWNIVGRPKSDVADFPYSTAMGELQGDWNYADLNSLINYPMG